MAVTTSRAPSIAPIPRNLAGRQRSTMVEVRRIERLSMLKSRAALFLAANTTRRLVMRGALGVQIW